MKKVSLIFLCMVITVLLIGCNEAKSDAIRFKVVTSEEIKKYPAKIKVNYYISNEAKNLYTENKYITFTYNVSRYSNTTIHPVKKNKDGYIIYNSKDSSYTIPETEFSNFGYSELIKLDKQNGQFEITVLDDYQYNHFKLSSIQGFPELCKQFNCYPKEELSK